MSLTASAGTDSLPDVGQTLCVTAGLLQGRLELLEVRGAHHDIGAQVPYDEQA